MNRRLLTVISLILLFALAVPLFAGCHDDDEGELIQKAKDDKRQELLDAGYGAKGIGEIAAIPTAPAVQGAYYALDGNFRTKLPLENTAYSK